MTKLALNAEKRDATGRKVKKLRKEGIIPANVYGKKVKSVSIQTESKTFQKVFSEAGETGLIQLTLGSEVKPVLIHHIQKNPVTDELLHIDFLQVDLTEKVTANVPVELINESPAEKQGLGTAVQYLNEIEVEALPGDLPDKFEIDLSNFTDVDQMVQIKDLKVDKSKVEIKAGEDEIVVKVEPQKEEKEEVAPSPAEGEEVAAAEEGTPDEKAAEGDKADASEEK